MSSGNDSSISGNSEIDGSEIVGDGMNSTVSSSAIKSLATSVGQQLRSARESSGMTTTDVARALKLGLNQVEALEADDWASLPGKTIIRGFVRNYARLLGLDSGRLMSELDGLVLPLAPELKMSTGTPVKFSQETKSDQHDYIRVFSGFVILVLAILAYFLVPPDLWQSTVSAIKNIALSHKVAEKTELPAVSVEPVQENVVVPRVENIPVAADKVAAIPNPLELDPQVVAAPEPAPQPEPVVSPPAEDVSLNFNFKQAAWLEVRDRTGKVLLSQLNQAGSQRLIDGEPPYSLIIGNAGHVELRYKGKQIDLSKRSKDDVARLTLE